MCKVVEVDLHSLKINIICMFILIYGLLVFNLTKIRNTLIDIFGESFCFMVDEKFHKQ
jgi:hypothetical protein